MAFDPYTVFLVTIINHSEPMSHIRNEKTVYSRLTIGSVLGLSWILVLLLSL